MENKNVVDLFENNFETIRAYLMKNVREGRNMVDQVTTLIEEKDFDKLDVYNCNKMFVTLSGEMNGDSDTDTSFDIYDVAEVLLLELVFGMQMNSEVKVTKELVKATFAEYYKGFVEKLEETLTGEGEKEIKIINMILPSEGATFFNYIRSVSPKYVAIVDCDLSLYTLTDISEVVIDEADIVEEVKEDGEATDVTDKEL